jgi:hypothetical protein
MVLDRLNITNAKITQVSHSEIEKFRRDTKIKSLVVAKEKAKQYAEAIDQQIGNALFIQEVNQSPYSQNVNLRSLNTSNVVLREEFGIIPNVTFKKISLTATVLTRFELKTKNE